MKISLQTYLRADDGMSERPSGFFAVSSRSSFLHSMVVINLNENGALLLGLF